MKLLLNNEQFLAAIAKSPQVQKSWRYEPQVVKQHYENLVALERDRLMSIDANCAAIFATTFMQQLLNLNADQ